MHSQAALAVVPKGESEYPSCHVSRGTCLRNQHHYDTDRQPAVFHVKHSLGALSNYLIYPFNDGIWRLLASYEDWLREEAIPAGGLGPNEGGRLRHRHIGDSLSFAAAFDRQPARLTDYGSGAGLPAIPLAILWPNTNIHAIDRSARRVGLIRRAVAILGLRNVRVSQREVADDTALHANIVTRAVLQPGDWRRRMADRLEPGGQAVTSLGSLAADEWVDESNAVVSIEKLALPDEVLDHSVTFLIMKKS